MSIMEGTSTRHHLIADPLPLTLRRQPFVVPCFSCVVRVTRFGALCVSACCRGELLLLSSSHPILNPKRFPAFNFRRRGRAIDPKTTTKTNDGRRTATAAADTSSHDDNRRLRCRWDDGDSISGSGGGKPFRVQDHFERSPEPGHYGRRVRFRLLAHRGRQHVGTATGDGLCVRGPWPMARGRPAEAPARPAGRGRGREDLGHG